MSLSPALVPDQQTSPLQRRGQLTLSLPPLERGALSLLYYTPFSLSRQTLFLLPRLFHFSEPLSPSLSIPVFPWNPHLSLLELCLPLQKQLSPAPKTPSSFISPRLHAKTPMSTPKTPVSSSTFAKLQAHKDLVITTLIARAARPALRLNTSLSPKENPNRKFLDFVFRFIANASPNNLVQRRPRQQTLQKWNDAQRKITEEKVKCRRFPSGAGK